MEKYTVHPNRVNMDCPRVVVSTVTFKTGCDVCMVEKWLSFYCLGESGVSLCGSSCRQRSLAGGLGPEVIMVSAEHACCSHTSTWHQPPWEPYWAISPVRDNLTSWKNKMLEPLHPISASSSSCRGCSEAPPLLHGKPFCDDSVDISGQASALASFLFPLLRNVSKGHPQCLCMFASMGLLGSPLVRPQGQSPPCAPLV